MLFAKVVLIGDGAVGKTSLRKRYMGEGFQSNYLLTIGADFAIQEIPTSSGDAVKFQIWDLAGQPRFKVVREVYYRDSNGALLVFDVTRPESFTNLATWVEELIKNNGEFVPSILIGNKSDLRGQSPTTISTEQGQDFANRLAQLGSGFTVPYIETSAKTGENVNNAFHSLADNVYTNIKMKKK